MELDIASALVGLVAAGVALCAGVAASRVTGRWEFKKCIFETRFPHMLDAYAAVSQLLGELQSIKQPKEKIEFFYSGVFQSALYRARLMSSRETVKRFVWFYAAMIYYAENYWKDPSQDATYNDNLRLLLDSMHLDLSNLDMAAHKELSKGDKKKDAEA